MVEIEGRLPLGDEPIQAQLAFGSSQGAKQIRLSTDKEGRFEGYLPGEVTTSEVVSGSSSVLHHNGTAVPVDLLLQIFLPKMKVGRRDAGLALEDMAPGDYSLCDAAEAECDAGYLAPRGEVALQLGPTESAGPG